MISLLHLDQKLNSYSGVIAEKDSADLFTIDTVGDAHIRKEYRKKQKPLRADEILAQRSAVAAVSMRKRPGEKTTDGILEPESKRQRVSYVTHKELARLRNIADGRQEQSVEVTESTYDPWDEKSDLQAQVVDPKFSFLPKTQKKVAPETLKEKPISLAASGKPVPAVSKPTGGYSYNPHFPEYLDRLEAAEQAELLAEQKRQQKIEKERIQAEAAAKSAREAEEAEKRAELSEWEEDESAWEGFESDGEQVKLNAKRPERKTQVQRNRIKRRKEEERKKKMASDIKRKEEQATHIKKISKAIKQHDEAKALALLKANNSNSESESGDPGEEIELRRRKLGKIQLPEKNLELVLPDELQESLRLLKPEGNALKERYRSVLVRGMVEARRPTPFRKQAKRKTTEKWTHKDFMLH